MQRTRARAAIALLASLLAAGLAMPLAETPAAAAPASDTCDTGSVPSFLTGAWCDLKQAERDICAEDFGNCLVVVDAKYFADHQMTFVIDDHGVLDGRQDSTQHCLWQLMITQNSDADYARRVGYAHETIPNEDPALYRTHAMDLHNNEVARSLSGRASQLELAGVAAGQSVDQARTASVVQACTEMVARAVRVETFGSAYQDLGVNVLNIRNADPYHGDFAHQLVYLAALDTRAPYTAEWAYPIVDNPGGSGAPLRSKFDSLGGVTGLLRAPTGAARGLAGGGWGQPFSGQDCGQGSALIWSSATNVHEMHGCIYRDYLTKAGFGGFAGQFGYPSSDEQIPPGGAGAVNYTAGSPCSSGQALPHSALYFRNGVTWGVKGCLFVKYRSLGETSSALGFPTSLEYSTSEGIRQDYQNGYMIWANGVASVYTASSGGCVNYGALITGPGACSGFSTTGTWFSGGGVGLNGREVWTYANGSVKDSSARYQFTGLDTTRAYQVQAYVPNAHSNSPNAHYVISSPGGGTANGYVNQQDYTNAWATVGGVCTSDGTATVTLWDDGGAAYPLQVGADAVRLVRTGTLCSG
ncbi:golvesin C-terminal-like domain-containing protein [Dactylosporangium darangshiense]|uniref:Uncharacterized protein n=1 Tax=Dactylosporangium darangshiense TaxID=579108 RepID=A0ABP8DSC7_9ACTN